jgi:hypothetical protein
MPIDFPPLRVGLYVALGLFSIVLLGLSGARIRYTTHLENGDPLNNGVNFYDPVVAELLFTSLVTFFWSIFMLLTLHKRWEHGFVSTFLFEIIVDVVLWLFWLGGAAAASVRPTLSFLSPHPWLTLSTHSTSGPTFTGARCTSPAESSAPSSPSPGSAG